MVSWYGHRKSYINCLEFSNFHEWVLVHIAIRTPIAFISAIDDMEYPLFSTKMASIFATKLLLYCPLFFQHVDCTSVIPTVPVFDLGYYQAFKLRKLFFGDYITRIISFQNKIMIAISRIHVFAFKSLTRHSKWQQTDETINYSVSLLDINIGTIEVDIVKNVDKAAYIYYNDMSFEWFICLFIILCFWGKCTGISNNSKFMNCEKWKISFLSISHASYFGCLVTCLADIPAESLLNRCI